MSQDSYAPCPFCGERRVSTVISTADGRPLHLVQSERAVTLFGGRSSTSPLAALTCVACGFTALYATQPGNLIPDA